MKKYFVVQWDLITDTEHYHHLKASTPRAAALKARRENFIPHCIYQVFYDGELVYERGL